MTSPRPLPIPQGLVKVRMPWKVPMQVAAVLGLALTIPLLVLGSWWLTLCLLPVLGLLYAFCAYWTAKDPQFLSIWRGNLGLQPYYY